MVRVEPTSALLIMGIAYVYYESTGKDGGSRMWDLLVILGIAHIAGRVMD